MEEISKNREELEELFEEKFEKMKMNEEYKKKADEYDKKLKAFFEELAQNQIDILDDILSDSNDLSYEWSKENFIAGFKTAINLIFESLKNN